MWPVRKLLIPPLVAAFILLFGAGPATGATVARLPVGSTITGLAVADDGSAWIGVVNRDTFSIGHVTAAGELTLRRTSQLPGDSWPFESPVAIGADGRPWFAWWGSARPTLLRVDSLDSMSTVGPFRDRWFFRDVARGPDGNIWAVASDRTILRIHPDGTSFTTPLPKRPHDPFSCSTYINDMAPAADGTMWLVDHCGHVIRASLDGSVDEVVRLEASAWFAAAPDGGMLYVGYDGFEGVLGRVTPDGRVSRFNSPAGVFLGLRPAVGPDGTAYYGEQLRCGLHRFDISGPLPRVAGPIVPRFLAFAPDGSLWITSRTRIMHTTVADLPAEPGACDDKLPRAKLVPNPPRILRLDHLRRHGFAARVSEPAYLRWSVNFNVRGLRDRPELHLNLHSVARAAGDRSRIRLPASTLRAVRKQLRRGRRVTLGVGANIWDREGNSGGIEGSRSKFVIR